MNMQKLLKQAQDMQEKMQRELDETTVDASVGGGMVTAKMNGRKNLIEVKIDPEAVDPDDVSLLEDLVVAAVNEANRKVDEVLQSKVGNLTAGLPGLF